MPKTNLCWQAFKSRFCDFFTTDPIYRVRLTWKNPGWLTTATAISKSHKDPSIPAHNKSWNVGCTVQRRQGVANVIPDKGEWKKYLFIKISLPTLRPGAFEFVAGQHQTKWTKTHFDLHHGTTLPGQVTFPNRQSQFGVRNMTLSPAWKCRLTHVLILHYMRNTRQLLKEENRWRSSCLVHFEEQDVNYSLNSVPYQEIVKHPLTHGEIGF